MTIRRPMGFLASVTVAQPASAMLAAPAAVALRKSRRLNRVMAPSLFLRSEICSQQIELRVGVALCKLVHDRCWPLTLLEFPERLCKHFSGLPRDGRYIGDAAASC